MNDRKQPDLSLMPRKAAPAEAEQMPADPAPKPKTRLDPTRYGDWELGGKCVDF